MPTQEIITLINDDYKNSSNKRMQAHGLYRRRLRLPATNDAHIGDNADGVPVLASQKVSDADRNFKIVDDSFSYIADNKAGYLASDIMRVYADNILDDVKDKYLGFDRLNNTQSLYSEMMSSCSSWGHTYTLCFINEKRVHMKQVEAWRCGVVYDEMTEQPKYGYILADERENANTTKFIYIYDNKFRYKYKLNSDKIGELVGEEQEHGFGEMPIIEWKNNSECIGNAQKATYFIDAYQRLISTGVTEVEAVRHAYMIIKNMNLDEEQMANLKRFGVIKTDGDGEVSFLSKDVNPEYFKIMKEEAYKMIWVCGSSVDPTAVTSLTGATAFQISQMYRLMESEGVNTVNQWKKSLEFLDRILKSYWTALDVNSVADYNTYDIDYIFKRNVPSDEIADLEAIKRAGGMLPNEYIIKVSTGVNDKEAKELAEQASQEMVDFMPNIGNE